MLKLNREFTVPALSVIIVPVAQAAAAPTVLDPEFGVAHPAPPCNVKLTFAGPTRDAAHVAVPQGTFTISPLTTV